MCRCFCGVPLYMIGPVSVVIRYGVQVGLTSTVCTLPVRMLVVGSDGGTVTGVAWVSGGIIFGTLGGSTG